MLSKLIFFVNKKGYIVAILKILSVRFTVPYVYHILERLSQLSLGEYGRRSPYDIDHRGSHTVRYSFSNKINEVIIKEFGLNSDVDLSRLIEWKINDLTFDESEVNSDSIEYPNKEKK